MDAAHGHGTARCVFWRAMHTMHVLSHHQTPMEDSGASLRPVMSPAFHNQLASVSTCLGEAAAASQRVSSELAAAHVTLLIKEYSITKTCHVGWDSARVARADIKDKSKRRMTMPHCLTEMLTLDLRIAQCAADRPASAAFQRERRVGVASLLYPKTAMYQTWPARVK